MTLYYNGERPSRGGRGTHALHGVPNDFYDTAEFFCFLFFSYLLCYLFVCRYVLILTLSDIQHGCDYAFIHILELFEWYMGYKVYCFT